MLKALLKKQFLELNTYYFQNKKTGKRRSTAGIAVFVVLYILLYVLMGAIFYFLADQFAPLIEAGMGWLYGAIMGIIAILYGTLGSAFSTYTGLYHAKDNDLMLSMPIPPRKLLFTRVMGVAMMGALYEAMVMIPAIIAAANHGLGGTAILFGVFLFLFAGVLVTALSCLLGWAVAVISAKFKNKNILTVVLSLAFISVYYYYSTKLTEGIQSLVNNSEQVGESVKSWLYPFYMMGKAWTGDLVALIVFGLFCTALMALVWLVLTKTFLGIVTKKTEGKKAAYREDKLRSNSTRTALFKKELRRFTHSPTYMLNCGLGIVMMLLGAVVICIYGGTVRALLPELFQEAAGFIPVLFTCIICGVSSMNDISSPSVSLEGKSIWIAQSLPVSTGSVLKSKLMLHEALTLPPTLILSVCVGVALAFPFAQVLLMAVTALLFVLVMARFGLMLNLKMPSLRWTAEAIPIKQSMPVLIALLGGWVISIGLGFAGYYLSVKVLQAEGAFLVLILLLTLAVLLQDLWLKKKGEALFQDL